MWRTIRIALATIPAGTFLLLAGVTMSGIDTGGDLPGLLRLLVFGLSVATWSALFSASMVVYAVKERYFRLLALAVGFLAARIVFFSELWWGNSEDHLYLLLPIEYLLFYLVQHGDGASAKCRFVLVNAGLYGFCLLLFGKALMIL